MTEKRLCSCILEDTPPPPPPHTHTHTPPHPTPPFISLQYSSFFVCLSLPPFLFAVLTFPSGAARWKPQLHELLKLPPFTRVSYSWVPKTRAAVNALRATVVHFFIPAPSPSVTRQVRLLSRSRHRRSTIFRRAVTKILSQWLLHKITNSRAVLIARIHACWTPKHSQETPILSLDTFRYAR